MRTVAESRRGGERRHRAEKALRAVLPAVVKVRPAPADTDVDLFVNGIPLAIKWAGEGGLRQVRPLLANRGRPPDIVVARRMSPGAREALSQAGIGWVDETGAAEIAIRSLIVSRTGRPGEAVEKPARWTASVMAVAEALLCGSKATVAATEEATGLSTGSCTTALRVLTDLGLLEAEVARGRDSARHVVDPDHLLDAYASAATRTPPRASLRVGVIWNDVVAGLRDTGQAWDESKVPWAATGAAASLVLGPLLTRVNTADVFVGADTIAELEAVAEGAGLRPIDGGRLTLLPFPTVTTRRLATRAQGLRIAPWPRIYADLRETGVRGEEAAEHLREVIRER